MKMTFKLITAVTILVASSSSFAINPDNVLTKKQTIFKLYLTANEAYSLISSNAKKILFIDVRTRAEVSFLGMPTLTDANIPYMTVGTWSDWDTKRKNFSLSPNNDFLSYIEDRLKVKDLTKNDTVVLICRSGSRSAKAANLLATAGYTRVYTIVDGYEGDTVKKGKDKGHRVVNGWKNANLPWSYKLDKAKMYFDL
ncbi:MAG: sulfurtransferase [Gammaproteobacteria bacterium]|nr:sulfurtransferase [Gammaproteobacteria bacterium]